MSENAEKYVAQVLETCSTLFCDEKNKNMKEKKHFVKIHSEDQINFDVAILHQKKKKEQQQPKECLKLKSNNHLHNVNVFETLQKQKLLQF